MPPPFCEKDVEKKEGGRKQVQRRRQEELNRNIGGRKKENCVRVYGCGETDWLVGDEESEGGIRGRKKNWVLEELVLGGFVRLSKW